MPLGNEKIFWQASPSKIATFLTPKIFFGFLLSMVLLHTSFLKIIETIILPLPIPQEFKFYAIYAPSCILFILAFWSFLQEVTKKFILTGERLILRHGVLIRTEDEVELYRVLDAIHTINIFQRIINVGTITVTSSDKTGTVIMNCIYSPAKVRNGLRQLVERCRNKRGVRVLE